MPAIQVRCVTCGIAHSGIIEYPLIDRALCAKHAAAEVELRLSADGIEKTLAACTELCNSMFKGGFGTSMRSAVPRILDELGVAIACQKCDGQCRPSTAYTNNLLYAGMPDFPGQEDTRVQTVSMDMSRATLVNCMKCVDCGHSFVPASPDKGKS